ncbi:LPS assembly protein LptD [Planctomycetota bacterium]
MSIRKNILPILVLLVLVLMPPRSGWAAQGDKAAAFAGQDLHMQGQELISYRLSIVDHVLVFQSGFSFSIGTHQFSADKAVVWLVPNSAGFPGSRATQPASDSRINYEATIYLQGNVSAKKPEGATTTNLTRTVIEQGRIMAIQFDVTGEIFITADSRKIGDPRGLELYRKAFESLQTAGIEPASAEAEPREIELQVETITLEEPGQKSDQPQEKKPGFEYLPVLSPVEEATQFEFKENIGTVIGRFYLYQKQDEKGGLLELQADNAVIFFSGKQQPADEHKDGTEEMLSGAQAIYMSGDIVMTNGQRTIRADEIYYDFQKKKAIAINAVMRNFDTLEGIPIYLRAAKLRQMAENEFTADNIILTTSEFYLPQLSFNASKVTITDTTTADEKQGGVTKSSYDAQMHDVRLKMYDKTFFKWPFIRSNMQRPDLPIKSAHLGNDNIWGTFSETRWYLARLLGLQEPEGTDSTLALDYYSKRGFGGGIETEYTRENYFGRILGYMIHDSGEDRLSRTRKNLEPDRELRGRFSWQHRQFLPYNWQLTTEASYLSDKNFLESFYRSEFYVGKEQETIIHAKRIEDNWGLSFLGKTRINDFENTLEELPTAEFHWAGQSFFDDKLTFYSDTQASRLRQRYDPSYTNPGSEEYFSFATTRNEIDMPMTLGKAKIVPFVAGTVAYEDGLGFYRELDGGMAREQENVWFGETGIRVSTQPYWKVYPDVKSELWDLNQLRHLIKPHLTAVGYTQNESVFEQRDTLNVGISQRLQTKRGLGDKQRNIDWMRLDMDVTWVNNSGDESAGADEFIWNRPFIPPINTFSRMIPQQDRRGTDLFGPRRNYVGADYSWLLSDTTAVLSDMNYDMQSGVVQQFNVGFSHMRWPNLQYYIGSRYLKRLDNGNGEYGSNAFTFAITYVLDPRYTVVYSQQLDFDYGTTVRSDLTLIRQYHRLYWGLTFSADESLDRQSIVFSLWPQGVPGLAIGDSKYVGLGGSAGY